MIRFFRLFLVLLFGLSSVGASALPQQVELDASCPRFEVRLSSNPTTGYQWTLESYDQTRFRCVKDEYVAPDAARMGASGEHVFYFQQKEKAGCPKSTILRFRHARAWEADSGTYTEVTVHFSKKKV